MIGQAQRWGSLFVALTLAVSPATAHADSYMWGGRVGRLDVIVHTLGFQEGAGVDGWEVESARRFSAWGTRIAAIIPRGSRVTVTRAINDERVSIEVSGRSRRPVTLPTQLFDVRTRAQLRKLLDALVRHFRVPAANVPGLRPGRLFTVQIAATPDHSAAARLARRIDDRAVRLPRQFYHETCAPCGRRTAKVLVAELPDRTAYRVVVGIFRSRRSAERTLRRLRSTSRLDGFVRVL